jgi:hypothetical protein
MRFKLVKDFDPLDKLKDPEDKPPLSLTKYEKYFTGKDLRVKTTG